MTMNRVISLVAILAVLLGGCAMSSTSSTDASRGAAPTQQPPKSGGSGY